jgi:plastocyanin
MRRIANATADRLMNKAIVIISAKVIVNKDPSTGLNKVSEVVTFDASDTGKHDVTIWEWDFNGDDEIDDYGPSVYTQFETPGKYVIKLWLTQGERRQLQKVHIEVVE